MHLVGDVGIFHHNYGFNTQGVMLKKRIGPVEGTILYSDNALDGGTGSPGLTAPLFVNPVNVDAYATFQDSLYRFNQRTITEYRLNPTGNAEDVLAVRAKTSWRDFELGATARLDRGYNPATLGFVDAIQEERVVFVSDEGDTLIAPGESARLRLLTGTEEWLGGGVDVTWRDALGSTDAQFEILYGEANMSSTEATEFRVLIATLAEDIVFLGATEDMPGQNRDFDLDKSFRVYLGVDDGPPVLGMNWKGSFEVHRHEFEPLATGLTEAITSDLYTWKADLTRPGTFHGRSYEPGLGFEYFDFDYDARSPWEFQFWFDFRNFWLESGEHEVSYDRTLLLGGEDAVFLRPRFYIDLVSRPEIRFEYDGTIAGQGFDREPKYIETLLKLKWKVRPKLRFLADARFVKYNDPILDLSDAYNSSFWELGYEVTPGVEIALSYGVDPYVLDPPVNEYAYIGRDLFLFERGASGVVARTDFLGLAEAIPGAETALEKERVIQIEAIMRF
jgi:hypothetical protein